MRNGVIPKERVIYSNYDVSDMYKDAKEFLMENMEDGEEPSEEAIWDEVYFQDDLTWEEEKASLKDFFLNESRKWILMGAVGRWDGIYKAGTIFEKFEDFFAKATQDCDYWKFYDENGHLYLTCSHHDGNCGYEIKAITERGIQYLDNWEYNWNDKRTEEYVHTQIFNRYSVLPHYAHKVYGVKRVEYQLSTKESLIGKLNNQARSFY